MTALDVFQHGNWSVRTLIVDEEPWFVAADVCTVLGYSNGRQAVKTHVDEADIGWAHLMTRGGPQRLRSVNESGLYALSMNSRLPEARTFKRWVTAEVLPSIRRYRESLAALCESSATTTRPPTFVYLAQCGAAIKIGFSADPVRRVASIQSANAEPVELLSVMPGDRSTERALHRAAATHHIRGEWFSPSQMVLDLFGAAS